LASVAWADEIIVVDSGSDDDTVAICQKFGALVSKNEWTVLVNKKTTPWRWQKATGYYQ